MSLKTNSRRKAKLVVAPIPEPVWFNDQNPLSVEDERGWTEAKGQLKEVATEMEVHPEEAAVVKSKTKAAKPTTKEEPEVKIDVLIREYTNSTGVITKTLYYGKFAHSWNETRAISGCGLRIIHGVTTPAFEDIEIRRLFRQELRRGNTAVLCTLGASYIPQYEPFVLEMGFVQIAEYRNFDHSTGNQRAYILTFEKDPPLSQTTPGARAYQTTPGGGYAW